MKTYFCPNCHRRIGLPEFLKNGNMKMAGKVIVNCGNCPTGKIVIKPEKQKENVI